MLSDNTTTISTPSHPSPLPAPPPLVRNKTSQSTKSTRFQTGITPICIDPHARPLPISRPTSPGSLTPCMKYTGYAPATLELAAVTPLPSLPVEGLSKVERADYFGVKSLDVEVKAEGEDGVDEMRGGSGATRGDVGVELANLSLGDGATGECLVKTAQARDMAESKLIKPVPHSEGLNPLHDPLASHLALLHPNTPREIIHFIATRLLSTEYPLGYTDPSPPLSALPGEPSSAAQEARNRIPASPKEEADEKGYEWTPIWSTEQDVQRAGVALDASRDTRLAGLQDEEGRREDERMGWMYGVARRGWGLVVAKTEA